MLIPIIDPFTRKFGSLFTWKFILAPDVDFITGKFGCFITWKFTLASGVYFITVIIFATKLVFGSTLESKKSKPK